MNKDAEADEIPTGQLKSLTKWCSYFYALCSCKLIWKTQFIFLDQNWALLKNIQTTEQLAQSCILYPYLSYIQNKSQELEEIEIRIEDTGENISNIRIFKNLSLNLFATHLAVWGNSEQLCRWYHLNGWMGGKLKRISYRRRKYRVQKPLFCSILNKQTLR